MKTLKFPRFLAIACLFLLLTISCEKNYPTTTIENPAPTYGLVKAVRSFNASSVLQGQLAANVEIVPNTCKTAAYVAGEGEVAIINMNSSLYISVVLNSILYTYAAVEIDNSGTFIKISEAAVESLNSGAASEGVSVVYPLTAGKSYVFASLWNISVGPVTVTKATGSATVLIVKQ